jgi:hypothetical protein
MDRWPGRVPQLSSAKKIRDAAIPADQVSDGVLQRLMRTINYYPEVQLSVLTLLRDEPNPEMIRVMAEAVLGVINPSGGDPDDKLRVMAIESVTRSIEAAVYFCEETE